MLLQRRLLQVLIQPDDRLRGRKRVILRGSHLSLLPYEVFERALVVNLVNIVHLLLELPLLLEPLHNLELVLLESREVQGRAAALLTGVQGLRG